MRIVFVGLLTASLAACAVLMTARDAPPARPMPIVPPPADARALPADGYFQEARAIAPGVTLIAHPEPFQVLPIGNVTVIEQSDGLVLIDSGGSPGSGERIVKLVRGLSDLPVKAIVITHWHGDHPYGLPSILRAWPNARIIATEATRAVLADPQINAPTPLAPDPAANAELLAQVDGAIEYMRGLATNPATPPESLPDIERAVRNYAQHRQWLDGAYVVQPTETFTERLLLDDPERPVELAFLGRANTNGDAIAWLPRQRVLVAGDIVVSPLPFGFGSYPADWIVVLQRLKAYDFATLIPGHGDPQTDRTYLDNLIALITETRAQVAPLAAEGLTLDQVRERVDLSTQAAIFAGEDGWRRRVFTAYWTRPMVQNAYREARGEEIVQGAN